MEKPDLYPGMPIELWREATQDEPLKTDDSPLKTFFAIARMYPQLGVRNIVFMTAMADPWANPKHSKGQAARFLGVSREAVRKRINKLEPKLLKRKVS